MPSSLAAGSEPENGVSLKHLECHGADGDYITWNSRGHTSEPLSHSSSLSKKNNCSTEDKMAGRFIQIIIISCSPVLSNNDWTFNYRKPPPVEWYKPAVLSYLAVLVEHFVPVKWKLLGCIAKPIMGFIVHLIDYFIKLVGKMSDGQLLFLALHIMHTW